MRQEVFDFVAEVDELAALLAPLSAAAWGTVTQFKDWTINDVVLHLFASDQMGLASLESAEAFAALRSDMTRVRGAGLSMIQETRLRFPGLGGSLLLERWRNQAHRLAAGLDARDPGSRMAWSGPGMSVRTFAAARQMESWAHGGEIYDVLGLARIERDRIRNIAALCIKTFGWSFSNRGLPIPEVAPYIELASPTGAVWRWNQPGTGETIIGEAAEFCAVAAQTRNVRDTALRVRGKVSEQWMAIAQCFAGPPSPPPAAGSRRKVGSPV